jgi:protein-L-isoaspartate(D-aspartate) O-methyltransferase
MRRIELILAIVLVLFAACTTTDPIPSATPTPTSILAVAPTISVLDLPVPTFTPLAPSVEEAFARKRERMVIETIERRGVTDEDVLNAMRTIPRHLFVPEGDQDYAYGDHPLPIGYGQTISQPYIVALMTELLEPQPGDRVLEVGTGSGYQAAVLSRLVGDVYTVEIKPILAERSRTLLQELGFRNVHAREGDGYFGWKEEAPFDGIMITAAVDHIPPPLLRQLAPEGKMVLPLGNPFGYQNLVLVEKRGGDYQVRQVTGVLFVPMTGQALSR